VKNCKGFRRRQEIKLLFSRFPTMTMIPWFHRWIFSINWRQWSMIDRKMDIVFRKNCRSNGQWTTKPGYCPLQI